MIRKMKTIFRKKFLKLPMQIVVEPTNKCNLNCPYCMVGMQNELVSKFGLASHSLMTRPAGFMNEEVFCVVLDNLKKFGIKKVYLHFQGEPFLNPQTPYFAKVLKQNNFEVDIFTNGMAFTDGDIKEIANIEIDLIRFSVDGASQETYGKNRVGGDFNKVYENMKRIVLACKGKKTRIEWQFLALGNNEHEIGKARKLSQDIGIHFFVKRFRETDPGLKTTNVKYHARFFKKPCKDIYRQIGVYWNGDVVPCCYDTNGREIMGNLTSNSLLEIWNSNKYKKFRARVDKASCDPDREPDLCKDCLRWR